MLVSVYSDTRVDYLCYSLGWRTLIAEEEEIKMLWLCKGVIELLIYLSAVGRCIHVIISELFSNKLFGPNEERDASVEELEQREWGYE